MVFVDDLHNRFLSNKLRTFIEARCRRVRGRRSRPFLSNKLRTFIEAIVTPTVSPTRLLIPEQ